MKSHLFRSKSLEWFSASEQLEELPAIIGLHYWLALTGLLLLLGGATWWAFQGTMTSSISGWGIFVMPEKMEVTAYIPSVEALRITSGMEVRIERMNAGAAQRSFIRGTVLQVNPAVISSAELPADVKAVLPVEMPDRNFASVRIKLQGASVSPGAAQRESGFAVSSGMLCKVEIVTTQQSPISLLLPYLKRSTEAR
jgi:hypothetical protein